jgi:hypothetical protein
MKRKIKRKHLLMGSIIILGTLAIVFFLMEVQNLEIYLTFITLAFIALYLIVYSGNMRVYNKSSPPLFKIAITISYSIAAVTLIYLFTSMFIPELPLIDEVDILSGIMIGISILLVLLDKYFLKRKEFKD